MLTIQQIDKALAHPELSSGTRKMLLELKRKKIPSRSKDVTNCLFILEAPIIKSSARGSIYVSREPSSVDVLNHSTAVEVCRALQKRNIKCDYFQIRKKLNGPR